MRVMDAKELNEHLVDYLYGELDPQQKQAFEAGLRRHPELQLELKALERTRATVCEMELLEPPASISESLLKEAAARAPGSRRPSLLSRLRNALHLLIVHPAVAAAAMLVLVLGISLFVYRRSTPERAIEPQGVVGDEALSKGVAAAPDVDDTAEDDRSVDVEKTGATKEEVAHEPALAGNVGSSSLEYADKLGSGAAKGNASAGRKEGVAREAAKATKGKRLLKRAGRERPEWETKRTVATETELAASGYRAVDANRRAPSRRSSLARSGEDERVRSKDGPGASTTDRATTVPHPRAVQSATALRKTVPAAPAGKTPLEPTREPQVVQKRQYAQPPTDDETRNEQRGGQGAWAEEGADLLAEKQRPRDAKADRSSALRARKIAMFWVQRANAAAKRKDCAQALAYYEKAVQASNQITAGIERQLGNCTALLARSRARYPTLARSIEQLRRTRAQRAAARQTKAREVPTTAAPDKAVQAR